MARNKALGVTESQFLSLLEPAFLNNDVGSATDWSGALDDPLSAANVVICLDPRELAAKKRGELPPGGGASPIPRWFSDARVALVMRVFEDAEKHHYHNDKDSGRARGKDGDDSSSAVAAELRIWFNTAFSADISMLDLLDARNTMRTLATTVVAGALH